MLASRLTLTSISKDMLACISSCHSIDKFYYHKAQQNYLIFDKKLVKYGVSIFLKQVVGHEDASLLQCKRIAQNAEVVGSEVVLHR